MFLAQRHALDGHSPVDGLAHVVDGEQTDAGRRQGLHLDAGLALALDRADAFDAMAGPIDRKIDRDPGERERVTQGNQIAGALGRLDRGDARDAQHVALAGRTLQDGGQGGCLHGDGAAGHGNPPGDAFVGDIHHVRLAGGIKMSQCSGLGCWGRGGGGHRFGWGCRRSAGRRSIIVSNEDRSAPLWSTLMNPTSRHDHLVTTACRLVGVVAVIVVIALIGTALPAPALAQADTLPRLGDAAGSDLSAETERRVGESIMQDLRRQRAVLDDAELADWLNRFAQRLSLTREARGQNLELFLLDDASLNAFALPGGFIGVHTGLIIAAQTESELASVLAHEIGHVAQRHIARMLAQNRESSVLSLAAVVLAMLAAGSNPQAAAGIVALGGSVHASQMLSFSRDAEREADRIGLEILRDAQFQPGDMIAFFGRMQQATRVYETGAPAYLRTHPLTSERMADIQNRVFEQRYRQRVDSPDFHLVRARLRVMADDSVDALASVRRSFEEQITNRSFVNEAAAWYGLAVVTTAQGDFGKAREALVKAAGFLTPDGDPARHPMLARLDIERVRGEGRMDQALAMAEQAIDRFDDARAIRHQKAQLLIDAKRSAEAIAFLEEERTVYRGDLTILQALARAYAENGQTGMSHWTNAERYVLLGALSAAREQLRIAQRDPSLDFYRLSQIDVRLREIEAQIRREQERS